MNSDRLVIATLGGHSALEICLGAHKEHLKTLVIVAEGRDRTYTTHFRNLVDDIIRVEKFSQLTDESVVSQLQEKNAVFVPHRYCQVYCQPDDIEKKLKVPVFGNKYLLRYEERSGSLNQYELLKNARIDFPKQFSSPRDIDRLVIVKVKEATRNYERAFFFARNFNEFRDKSAELIKSGRIRKEDLPQAVIEEYLIGAQVNFNFFYSPLLDRIELLGTDIRRQTNIDGLIRLPAVQQNEIASDISPSYIESGHIAVTVKESLLEEAFRLAERLVGSTKNILSPGIIGPFALQTAVIPGPPRERIVVYDLSLRIPGSPGTVFTPYSRYHFGTDVSFGERIAMEIKKAGLNGQLSKITT